MNDAPTDDELRDCCRRCRYFLEHERSQGECHRYPPRFAGESSPNDKHHWRFPLVASHAWCGEFLPAD